MVSLINADQFFPHPKANQQTSYSRGRALSPGVCKKLVTEKARTLGVCSWGLGTGMVLARLGAQKPDCHDPLWRDKGV